MKRTLYIVISLHIILLGLIGMIEWNSSSNAKTANKIGPGNEEWTAVWTASLQAPYEDGVSSEGFENQTLRFILKPHIDGDELRIRLSNQFGDQPLTIDEIHVAITDHDAENVPDTEKQLTFDGDKNVTIPQGERLYSDPVQFELSSEKKLSVSMYVKNPTGVATWHPHAMQKSYIASGNHTAEADGSSFDEGEEAWFWLDAVDVKTDSAINGAIAVVGDSIANGNHSEVDADQRWTDYLAKRFNEENPDIHLTVLNAGISANQLLNSPAEKGEHMLARLERDVFSQSAIKAVIFNGGINDIRHHPDISPEIIINQMQKIINSVHDEGLKIYGATLTPFGDSDMYTEQGEQTRQKVNEWIRSSGAFDGVIDFDQALRDPQKPKRLLPEYDADDHFHPNHKGYQKMAEEVDLTMFK